MPTTTSTSAIGRLRVLVVDDDTVIRRLLRAYLAKLDCEIVEAASAEVGLSLARAATERFDMAVVDYWMPGMNGIEMLKVLGEVDSTLSVALMTADEERDILEKLIRQGGCDFLRKPIKAAELLACLRSGSERTRRLRRLGGMENEAAALGASQRQLLERHLALAWPEAEFYFTSKSEASGDFVSVIPVGEDSRGLLASDGSGHDLSSAFQSNYFHGLARGMLRCGTPLSEVFNYFNELILSEWNGDQGRPHSLAACALEFDVRRQSVRFLNAGFPRPMAADANGFAEPLGGEVGEPPLGWFPRRYETLERELEDGFCYLWTDGLSDQAEKLQLDPLALAGRLLDKQRNASSLVAGAADDIAVVRLRGPSAPRFAPVISVDIAGDQIDRIDEWQGYFERSLRIAATDMDNGWLTEILVCLRESVANALVHGCRNERAKVTKVRVALSICGKKARAVIADPGLGHSFDIDNHARCLGDSLISEHRGLMIMRSVPTRFQMEDGGRRVKLEFEYNG